jgi:hypothetical protein
MNCGSKLCPQKYSSSADHGGAKEVPIELIIVGGIAQQNKMDGMRKIGRK